MSKLTSQLFTSMINKAEVFQVLTVCALQLLHKEPVKNPHKYLSFEHWITLILENLLNIIKAILQ